MRVESPPGEELQIDVGQKGVRLAGNWARVFLLVGVLNYSRRPFVKPLLNERQDDWREGGAAAFTNGGGVPRTMRAITRARFVLRRDRGSGTVIFHPAYLAFCPDWAMQPRACAPLAGAH